MQNRNNDGLFGGNGTSLIVLILFFLMFGGGFGRFNNGFDGNSAAVQGALTRAELTDGLNNQDVRNSLANLSSQVNRGFDDVQLGMNNGFNSVNSNLCHGFSNLNMNMQNGFNGVQSSIADSRYAMQNCCCDIKNAIHSEGEATRALIQENTIQGLRDTIAAKDRELLATGLTAAQTIQTNTLENFIRQVVNGCGC